MNIRATSSRTPSNTRCGVAPSATSVATRRSAACSSASCASCSCASLFAIAVAKSSANSASRCSVSRGQRLLALRNDCQHAPEAALDGDRRSHGRAPAHLAGGLGRLARRFCVVLDASGPARLEDQARHGAFELVAPPDVDVPALGRPAAHRSDGPVCLVARESGAVRANQCRHLRAHGFEHLCRWRARCNQRRHAPQRRLLVGELRELLAGLAVGDRSRHQLGELREPILGMIGERRVRRRHPHGSPDRAVDDDRGARSRVEAGLTSCRRRARREGPCSPRPEPGGRSVAPARPSTGRRAASAFPAGARADGRSTQR